MEKRENSVEQFSTFLDFRQQGKQLVCCWRSPLDLLRFHTELMVDDYPEGDTEFWAKYWLRDCLVFGGWMGKSRRGSGGENLGKSPPAPRGSGGEKKDGFWCFFTLSYLFAKTHFSAYLEETCYAAALDRSKDFNFHGIEDKELFGEFFSIARKTVASPQKTFRSYDLSHPKCSKVSSWAEAKIKAAIREHLIAQNLMRVVDKYSDWGVLRNFSKKQIKECLQDRGLVELEIQRCLLALQTFGEIYSPKKPKGKLLSPTDREWQGIFERFNQLAKCHNLPLLAKRQEVESLLKTCVDAVRAPNSPIGQTKEEKTEDNSRDIFEWLDSILIPAYQELSAQSQLMLKLWYGLQLNQTDIGLVFGIKQWTVSRQKDKDKEPLFFALLKWLKQQKRGSNITDEEVKKIEGMLDEWLADFSKQFFGEVLQCLMLELADADLGLLGRRYGGGKLTPTRAIARQLRTSDYEVKKALKRVDTDLENRFKVWLESLLNYPVADLNSSDRRVKKLVANWLRRSP